MLDIYLFQFAGGPQHGVNRGLLTTLARFSGLPAAQNQYIIFVVPKDLAQFNSTVRTLTMVSYVIMFHMWRRLIINFIGICSLP